MKVPEIFAIELGEPWKLNEKAGGVAIPILRQQVEPERNYKLLSEVEDKVVIRDTGSISVADVKNNSSDNVFMRKGTIVKGGSQTRAVINSVVVGIQSKIGVPVRCVYASKGIRAGTTMTATNYVPPMIMSALSADQSETWNSVRDYTTLKATSYSYALSTGDMSASLTTSKLTIPTDDLEGFMDAESDIITEALKKVPASHVKQVGLIVVDTNGVAGFELFDHPDAWNSMSNSVYKNYADILNNAIPDLYEINLEKAKEYVGEFLTEMMKLDSKIGWEENEFKTYNFENDKYNGEFTTIDENVMHILIVRRYTPKSTRKTPEQLPPITITPWRNPAWDRSGWTDNRWINNDLFVRDEEYRWTNENDCKKQEQASLTVNLLTKKRGYETLTALQSKGRTFTELETETGMSSRTVSKAIKESEELGLIQKAFRQENGSTVYELTPLGKRVNPKKFKATIEG